MSRTDAHRPYRVRAADELELGRYARHYHTYHWWRHHQVGDLEVCDLGDHPYESWRTGDTCTWELESWVYSPYGHSTKRERRVYGHKPDRARARRKLGRIKGEANAGWREDWDVFSPQARHSVDWLVS